MEIREILSHQKFKGPVKSFGYWGLKLLPGIQVNDEGLARRAKFFPYQYWDYLFSNQTDMIVQIMRLIRSERGSN